MDNIVSILMGLEGTPPPEESIKIKRLSKLAGQEVNFTLRAIGYDRVEMLQRQENPVVDIVLAGTVSPDWKSRELQDRYKAATPAELVKKVLLPGEAEEISRRIQRLSGYLDLTCETVKKK